MGLHPSIFAAAIIALPATALACEYDYDEEYVFANARIIYVAEIVSGAESPSKVDGFHASVVKPLKAIRGELPDELRTLSAIDPLIGCSPIGDGDGAYKPAGALVFVFEGLPKSHYPGGVQSFGIESAEKSELIESAINYLANVAK